MAFQVCLRDEYGQTSNVVDGKFETLANAVEKAKELVNSDNIDNALTLDEKRRNWTAGK